MQVEKRRDVSLVRVPYFHYVEATRFLPIAGHFLWRKASFSFESFSLVPLSSCFHRFLIDRVE